MNNERIFVDEFEAKAMFLKTFPNITIKSHDGKSLYWYDVETEKFYYQKPFNKSKNKVYEARGLKSHFNRFVQKLFTGVC